MTTIAYKDGFIAADGQMTAGDVIVTSEAVKVHSHDGVDFWLCGCDPDIDALILAWPNGKLDRRNNAGGFALNQGMLFATCQDGGECSTWEHPRHAPFAYGSGYQFAIGAMDAGLTAREAVLVAAGRDTGTGGTIRVYDAKTGEEV